MTGSKHAMAFIAVARPFSSVSTFTSMSAAVPSCRQIRHSSFVPRTPTYQRSIHTFQLHPFPATKVRRSTTPVASTASPSNRSPVLIYFSHIMSQLFSLILLVVLQSIAASLLAAMNITFPAPLGAMLMVLAIISLLRFLKQSVTVDRAIRALFSPAVVLLSRWLPVFFVPNLVMLPLAPALPAADVTILVAFIPIAFGATLFATATLCCFLRRYLRSSLDKSLKTGTADALKVIPPHVPSNQLLAILTATLTMALYLSVRSVAATGTAARVYALSATLLTFCIGQRLPRQVKMILHPLIVCTGGTIGAIAILASLTGTSLSVALSAYYVRSANVWGGAGNMLSSLLGPAVITFAFTVDEHRRLAIARRVEVFGAGLFTAVTSLCGTALLGRMLGLAPSSRLLLLPRTVTAPLAIPIASLIGADVRLAASVVALTGLIGANVGRVLLTILKVKDPVVRGLALGASAHGLGTAAMAEERDALPFAALAMTLVGVLSTILVAISPFRKLLLRLAIGSVAPSVLL